MKRIISIILMACIIFGSAICVHAEEATATPDSTFDFSAEQQKVEELGIPTVASVAALKKEADALWAAKDYAKAADAYAVYAKQANWLANIITAGLEPFYGASADKRKSNYVGNLGKYDLVKAEKTSNSYKTERNRAILYEGLCYYYMNDYKTALPLLIKALDLIDITDKTNWQLGMEALYAIVGY